MKQRITPKQLTELKHEQKLRLLSLWIPQNGDFYIWYGEKGGTGKEIYVMDDSLITEDTEAKLFALPILSIGQMIGIIQDMKPLKSISKARFDKWIVNIGTETLGYKDELCDSLWETVTRIL